MFLKRWLVGFTLPVVLFSLTGCGTSGAPDGDGRLQVSASVYPFGFIAERIGGEQVAVTNLTTPGSEPHDLELTPKQIAALGDADLVIFQTGFQPAVEAAVTQMTPRRVLDTATFLTLLPAATSEANETDTGHDHGALDPHTWLDPERMITITEHVRDELIQTRPESEKAFASNAAALIDALTQLDQRFENGLARCERRTFITSHAAFGYLADRYQLHQVGIRGLEPDVEPSAARIVEVQQIARAEGVTTIFFETLVSPAVAQSIADDLGLATDVLDPLEGITAESRGQNYLEVMDANLTALKQANSCD